MIGRMVSGAMVVACGVSAAQLPEFAQQYRQRLGGAVEELKAVVERFDQDASAEGLTRAEALKRHAANADELFRRRGEAMVATIERHNRLEDYRRDLNASSATGLLMSFATRLDGQIARSTLKDYEPAIPVTSEGGVLAFLGACLGWLLAKLFGWPKRTVERKLAARNAGARQA